MSAKFSIRLSLSIPVLLMASVSSLAQDHCEAKSWTINGSSLSPLLQSGEEVQGAVLPCNVSIGRDDLIIFRHAGNANPVIKVVKGLSGETFGFVKNGSASALAVGGSAVVNSAGEPYIFNGNRRAMLKLYMQDYAGKIPRNAFLVLGDNMNGTIDSSTFGLVHADDLIAVVKRETLE